MKAFCAFLTLPVVFFWLFLQVPNIFTEPTNSEPEPKSSVSFLQILTVLGAAAAVLAFVYLRRSRKGF